MVKSVAVASWRAAFLLTVLVVTVTHAAGATYYVSTTGANGNDGSAGSPWLTLQHAADNVTVGDTVIVLPGNYQGFDLRTSGAAGMPITFSAQPGVMITQNNPATPDGINVENASHVVIEGFTVNERTRAGIRVVGTAADPAQFVTVRNNITDANGRWGIFTGFVDDLLIENNKTSNSGLEHGIYVSNSGDRPVLRGNESFGNRAGGIQLNADASLGGDGIISNALIEANVLYNNGTGGGSAINLDGVQDSVIQNNLIYGNHASGISLFMIDGAEGSKRNLVVNNTIIQASDARWALNIVDGSTHNQIFNNILLNLHPFRGSITISTDSLTGFVSDYNIVMDRLTVDDTFPVKTLAQWQIMLSQDLNSIVATLADLFIDPDNNDYRLKSDSLAIDAGLGTFAPLIDLLGNIRPSGDVVDIGAYELQQDAPPSNGALPEPGTAMLLFVSGAMLLRRNRH